MKMAAGATIYRFARNLSLILHPCVCVATTVVSDINDRLSPKNAPPTTTPVIISTLMPVDDASPVAIGTSAATVPTLVPTESDMKQAATKIPAIIICGGSSDNARFTVLSILPIAFADDAKAPANMNIHIMSIIFSELAPLENILTLS